jgi:fatty-acyl-CoA synthase
VAETIQQKLRERLDDVAVAVRYGDEQRTWREHLADAGAQAAALLGIADHARPVHIGALLGNTPDMLTAMAAAGLGGYVLCGINNTRRGSALARDILHADCQILLTDADHRDLLADLDLPGVRVVDVCTDEWAALVAGAGPLTPHREAGAMDTFMLIFTSGTSGDPKAVQVPHITVLMAGTALADRFRITAADVCYLSMPLFHSNALLAGWSVAVESGAAMVPAAFSASGVIDDVRRYGVTYMNYVGKPLAYVLATPARPDDAENPLRIAFGNEASDRDINEFGRRFACTVWDGFGSTEGAVIVTREIGCPPGSIGKGFPGVAIYDPDTQAECHLAEFDPHGALINADKAIGELVNTAGAGMFQGYYNDASATDDRLRNGIYWSGDLAYQDADGWIYLAGRTSDWMRVDGENMATAPIERVLLRHGAISQVTVYGVADEHVGDQVMAGIVLHDGVDLTPTEFEAFLNGQADLSPKAWPRHVWLTDALPATATNKVLKRELTALGSAPVGGRLWIRAARGTSYAEDDRRPAAGKRNDDRLV